MHVAPVPKRRGHMGSDWMSDRISDRVHHHGAVGTVTSPEMTFCFHSSATLA